MDFLPNKRSIIKIIAATTSRILIKYPPILKIIPNNQKNTTIPPSHFKNAKIPPPKTNRVQPILKIDFIRVLLYCHNYYL